MHVEIVSPTKAYIKDYTDQELALLDSSLSYKDLTAKHLLNRHSKNHWFKSSNPVKWKLQYDLLKSQIDKKVLHNDENGYYIRPGSIPYLDLDESSVTNNIKYPTPKKIPWAKPLPFQLYNYQEKGWQELLKAKHANVSMCTGSGKSAVLLKLCRETGFRCAVVAPSKGIFNELVEKFEYHLGKNNVGKFGDGKKKIGKRITVCIGDSLVNIEKNTKEYEFFSNLDMIVIDESHTWSSDTLENVCHGVFSEVPYRFFLSATQTRGDGGLKLLQSIIGPTVHSLTTEEAVQGGYICPHDFKIVHLKTNNPPTTSTDPLEVKRECFLRNKNIALFITKLATAFAAKGEQTLILCEELSQIAILNKYIPNLGYAHSETNKERLDGLNLVKVDVAEQIERFNKNEIKVLAGTSCLHVGVNIFPMTNTVNWVGGSSEVKTKQAAVGRSVRLSAANPYKNLCGPKPKCTIWDFDVEGNAVLERHLESRIEYYNDSGPGLIKHIRF